ncbi:MAG TPA: dihydrodipicolinate synthase family protein, partial [Candidatus Hydrogenedentes bacterium]|nr:dihydrodipicolinate synthase family protein [Candidatus Hydrogenedentota bacterium]
YAAARETHYRLAALFKGLFIETNPMPVKAALARMGLIENVLRLPLVPLTESKQGELDRILKDLSLL